MSPFGSCCFSAVSSAGGGTPAVSTSVVVVETVTGSHVMKIDGYSRTKGIGSGNFFRSDIFNVGGHSWCIQYYPDGATPEAADWISLYIELNHTDALDVKAQFKFSLHKIGKPVSSLAKHSQILTFGGDNKMPWGFQNFIERKIFEKSSYLKDDCFSVRCDVTVTKEIRTEASTKFVTVPPSDIHRHLSHLLSSEEDADVTFEVDGDTFRARVFKALLHFIYTDSLPQIDKDDTVVMAQHLLVAADRYGMERLKLVCEDILCTYINISTAATTLVLAEQHGCNGLKEACFKFLGKSSNFKAVIVTAGFQHLTSSCPSVLRELLAKAVP
ncbi:unnamed protein product [Urochloa decumbens]|uniref:MATH domain-containing protein n=1 Tax=Urochloa decumbens TaxID=240449 RepID=A0ABC9AV45_9POAL